MSTGSHTDRRTDPTVGAETTGSWFGRSLLVAVAIVAVGVSLLWLLTRDAGSESAPGLERTNAALETPPVTADSGPSGVASAAAALPHDLPCTPTCGNLAAGTLPIELLPPTIAHDLPCTPTCGNLAAGTPPPTAAIRYDLPCTPTCSG